MDFKDLASRLGIDEEDFQELVELFITTSNADIDKIKKGLDSNNAEDAAAASHSIKGAAGNLGFDEIYGLAQEMEMQAKQGSLENFQDFIKEIESKVNALGSF